MLRKPLPVPDDALEALGNPERRRLMQALAEGPRSVGELAAQLPISRPAVSRHLAQLERARLVAHRAAGTRNIYVLDPTGLSDAAAWLTRFRDEAEALPRPAAQKPLPRKAQRRG